MLDRWVEYSFVIKDLFRCSEQNRYPNRAEQFIQCGSRLFETKYLRIQSLQHTNSHPDGHVIDFRVELLKLEQQIEQAILLTITNIVIISILYKDYITWFYMSIDTNIDNYTIADMEDFLELPEDYTENYINILIDSIPIYDEDNKRLVEGMRKRLLESLGVTDINKSRNIVNLPAKYEDPYEKEEVNPFAINEVSSLISLNTRFVTKFPNDSHKTHDYTVNLTEKLQRVTSIRISNLYLPTTWYTIASENEGTIEFTKYVPSDEIPNPYYYHEKIVVPKGVYTITTLIDVINEKFVEGATDDTGSSPGKILEYDVNTDKIKVYGKGNISPTIFQNDIDVKEFGLNTLDVGSAILDVLSDDIDLARVDREYSDLYGTIVTDDQGNVTSWGAGSFLTSNSYELPSENLTSRTNKQTEIDMTNASFDENKVTLTVTTYDESWGFRQPYRSVGRILGFRKDTTTLTTGESPQFEYDLDGTRNVMIVVDDFTRNSYSGNLVTTDIVTTKMKVPEYVKDSECPQTLSDRVSFAGRKPGLTYHELYSLNEIAANRTETLPELAPSPSEILGIVPVYPGTTPYPITSSGGDISGAIRNYFGPVSISKLRVRLLDDGGEPLDIQNEDWSLTLSVSRLYKY